MDVNSELLVLGLPIVLSLAGVLFKYLVSLLPQRDQYAIEQAVVSVVRAVEQSLPGANGEVKKEEAMRLAELTLKALRLPVDPTVLHVLIEEAVSLLPKDTTPVESALPTVGA